jgi:Tfp pilus assembly protein PilX
MPTRPHPNPRTQRGAATLALTVALFLALLLTLVYVNRNLVFEQRSATNLMHSTQAFEAAEAGLAWAGAQLNNPTRIDTACQPAAGALATSFRERLLRTDATSGAITVATWDNAGTATPLQAACVRSADGWSCSCPAAGPASPVPQQGLNHAPAFRLQFVALPQPGLLRVAATGCTSLAGDCALASTTADATARVTVDLALWPVLKAAPAAALTARGSIATAAATVLRNADVASGGIAAHAGGTLGPAQIEGPLGSPAAAAALAGDTALAAQTADELFASTFGMPRAVWAAQAMVKTLRCEGDCGEALASLINDGGATTIVHAPGPLRLAGPLTLGTALRPVLIVVDGELQLQGHVVVHGLLYSAAMRWDDAGGANAQLHGAAITEGNFSGNAAPQITRDAAVIARLQQQGGSFVRVGGSWRDF